jgi:hypothetical protein
VSLQAVLALHFLVANLADPTLGDVAAFVGVAVESALQGEHFRAALAGEGLALLVNALDVVVEEELVPEGVAAQVASVADLEVLRLYVSHEAILPLEGLKSDYQHFIFFVTCKWVQPPK